MGIALKHARNKQKISLRNLAIKISTQSGIDLSFGYLSDLETGKNDSIKKDKLLAITKALGISVNDLYL
jgi:transcriptional regulator with XRE-family HTH domain